MPIVVAIPLNRTRVRILLRKPESLFTLEHATVQATQPEEGRLALRNLNEIDE